MLSIDGWFEVKVYGFHFTNGKNWGRKLCQGSHREITKIKQQEISFTKANQLTIL